MQNKPSYKYWQNNRNNKIAKHMFNWLNLKILGYWSYNRLNIFK